MNKWIRKYRPPTTNWLMKEYQLDKEFSSYEEYAKEDRFVYTRWGVFSGFLTYLSFFWVDYALYPDKVAEIWTARTIYCLFMIVTYFAYVRYEWMQGKYFLHVWSAVEAIALGAFMVLSGDPDAPYAWSLVVMISVLGMVLDLPKTQVWFAVLFSLFAHYVALHFFIEHESKHHNHWVFLIALLWVAGMYAHGVARLLGMRARQIFELRNREQRANKQLQALNEDLESFSYSAAHDLKSPLRAIQGIAEELKEDCRIGDRKVHGKLSLISLMAQEMNDLIQQLLWLSSVVSYENKIEKVDVTALTWEIIKKRDWVQKVIPVFIGDLNILADKTLIRMILTNLLENSIKYGSKDGIAEIEISGDHYKSWKDRVVYCFRDYGGGFSKDLKENIFAPFFQAMDSEGHGIGLSIVKRCGEKLGANVWATGEDGAAFYFEVPRKETRSVIVRKSDLEALQARKSEETSVDVA